MTFKMSLLIMKIIFVESHNSHIEFRLFKFPSPIALLIVTRLFNYKSKSQKIYEEKNKLENPFFLTKYFWEYNHLHLIGRLGNYLKPIFFIGGFFDKILVFKWGLWKYHSLLSTKLLYQGNNTFCLQ